MKVLSVRQPWAWLIFHCKDIENRTWKTNYRGKLLIHAGMSFDHSALSWIGNNTPTVNYLNVIDQFDIIRYCRSGKSVCRNKKLFGVILGSVDLVDCVQNHSSKWAMKDCWHWVLENPVSFDKPIPCKGQLGLFNPPENLNQLITQG